MERISVPLPPHQSTSKRKPKHVLSNRVRWTTAGLGVIRGGIRRPGCPQSVPGVAAEPAPGLVEDEWLDLEWLLIYKRNLEVFTEQTRMLRRATDENRVEICSAARILLMDAARLAHFAAGSPIESLNPFSPASA
jgi:hypothetical protein